MNSFKQVDDVLGTLREGAGLSEKTAIEDGFSEIADGPAFDDQMVVQPVIVEGEVVETPLLTSVAPG